MQTSGVGRLLAARGGLGPCGQAKPKGMGHKEAEAKLGVPPCWGGLRRDLLGRVAGLAHKEDFGFPTGAVGASPRSIRKPLGASMGARNRVPMSAGTHRRLDCPRAVWSESGSFAEGKEGVGEGPSQLKQDGFPSGSITSLAACCPGDQMGECRAHGNLGSAFFSKGSYREALSNHRLQLMLAMKLKDREVGGRGGLLRPSSTPPAVTGQAGWDASLGGL